MAAARKAVALDETLPEAHLSLASASSLLHDHDEQERQLARALELNPNLAAAMVGRISRLVMSQQYNEAERLYQQVHALDPMSSTPGNTYGVHLGIMRQYDRSIAVLRETTARFPDDPAGHAFLGMIYAFSGRHAEALASIERAGPARNPAFATWKAFILARAGREAEARAIAARLEAGGMARYVPAYYRALLHCELGDREETLALLEQSAHDNDWQLRYLRSDPSFDAMRSDPRFFALLKKLFGPYAEAK